MFRLHAILEPEFTLPVARVCVFFVSMSFDSEKQLDDLWKAFSGGTLPKAKWTHHAHLAIAGILVWRDPQSALALAREGILALNVAQGTVNSATSGYHETLTVFWIRTVTSFCERRRSQPRLHVVNEMFAQLPRDLFRQYYSFDVVQSQAARREWIEPDLKSVP
jgi:hypothetical protein